MLLTDIYMICVRVYECVCVCITAVIRCRCAVMFCSEMSLHLTVCVLSRARSLSTYYVHIPFAVKTSTARASCLILSARLSGSAAAAGPAVGSCDAVVFKRTRRTCLPSYMVLTSKATYDAASPRPSSSLPSRARCRSSLAMLRSHVQYASTRKVEH